jgi:hypothetical protein
MAANDIIIIAAPALTNQGLALGRINIVATNANIVVFNGGGFGTEGFPFTATLTDAQIASPLAFTCNRQEFIIDPPGSIGVLNMGGGVVVRVFVLETAFVPIGAGVKNPWTGLLEAALIWRELAYVEVCRQCEGQTAPSLLTGGERFVVELATAPDNDGDPGAITASPAWTRQATGIALAPNA